MPGRYLARVSDFLRSSPDQIIGQLSAGTASEGFHSLISNEIQSWQQGIELLKETFGRIQNQCPAVAQWSLILEYPLLRLEQRIDGVVLANDLIFVLEFKQNRTAYDGAAIRKAEEYALNLHDFHHASQNRQLIPILCATHAKKPDGPPEKFTEAVKPVLCSNSDTLWHTILMAYQQHHDPRQPQIDSAVWNLSPYKPVPTIIEAAQMLYAGHTVADLARASATVYNLARTTRRLIELIDYAQKSSRHIICFVTGVPGSGKTLTGLNAVHDPLFHSDGRSAGTFLSGNRPLVEIVREALARDRVARSKEEPSSTNCKRLTKAVAQREVKAQIQHIINYLRQYTDHEPDAAPYEHAIVFDEAQRAWNAEYGKRKFNRNASEPELFLQIMERHPDWAAIIALVGGGQEINRGEAGLAEWGNALLRHPKWEVYISPEVVRGGASIAGSTLLSGPTPANLKLTTDRCLHLPVSVRSYRSERVAAWVNAVLQRDVHKAKTLALEIENYPIVCTRNLDRAKSWLTAQTRGNQRCGLLASSSAKRLRAYGIYVYKAEELNDVINWFLCEPNDIRAANQLEVAISEFACQGLELDFTTTCWGWDFTISTGDWRYRRLRGDKWSTVNSESDRLFVMNKYRVLLTRARQGMVIWLPHGDPKDPTRNPRILDDTAEYLLACGADSLD